MPIARTRVVVWTLVLAVALGVYLAGATGFLAPIVSLMTLGFLLGIPVAIGYVTVWTFTPTKRWTALLLPWVSIAFILSVLLLFNWEGTICIVLVLPFLLAGASLGGQLAFDRGDDRRRLVAIGLLPFVMMPLEQLRAPSDRVQSSVSTIMIAATPERVWDEIATVDSIRSDERSFALYTAIGFPAPHAATLDVPQEGGSRVASFDRGVRFVETITDWEPHDRLGFAIDPVGGEDALDQHVTIGGPHFDVLRGEYRMEARGDSVLLTLTSEHRVTTRLNFAAGWWASRVMVSVQREILGVIAARAENPSRTGKDAIRAATAARALREFRTTLAASSMETGFSTIGDNRGTVDIYADSVVVLVRDGVLADGHGNYPDMRLDSITASLAMSSGRSWSAGRPSNAFIVESHIAEGERRSLGPLRRFVIPRDRGESYDGRWVVFTYHLAVPRTESNPYGWATTYAHDTPLAHPNQRPVDRVRTP